MNVETQMDVARSLRTHKVKGQINFQDLNNLLKGIYNSAEFDQNLHSLWDIREGDLSAVKPEEIRALAEYVRANWAVNRKNKAAIVVSGKTDLGVSRMYEHILGASSTGKVKVFQNIKSAWDWIEGKMAAPTVVIPQPVKQSVPEGTSLN